MNDQPNGTSTPDDQPKPRLQLVISLMPDGSVTVHGPINDKFACYALLECARDVIKDHVDKAVRSRIVPAKLGAPFMVNQRDVRRS